MNKHEKLNYVEFATRDLVASKRFFVKAFGWDFVDYGPDYSAFSGYGLDGGFFASEQVMRAEAGGALLVFYSEDIKATEKKVQEAGGEVVRGIFDFPGGCRFHFVEPGGNELAVWSKAIV
ncbi:hypothetical protein EOPP23_18805 [Endozoicomonas sp. OPT23]|uniref:VOC family protein n=1 Tax=Endozoicomonas sp. OPT23 TaxID=2072845 RepID=UPI00129ACA8F|nr:VOC family protein [Endozoicomonas sp. OPT23]MRI35030.1 hypothetical protein [Endozoicomonas sp. OPT23]